jgi:hypothetical protein
VVVNPFFGSPDPVYIAMTRLIIHWRVLAICAMLGTNLGISQPSQSDMPMDQEPSCSKSRQNLPAEAYRAKFLGISCCDGRDMPTVAIERMATVGELDAKS